MPDVSPRGVLDHRMVVPAAAAWAAAAVGVHVRPVVSLTTAGVLTAVAAVSGRLCPRVFQAALVVAAAVFVVCGIRVGAVSSGPVAAAGDAHAAADAHLRLTSDPRVVQTGHGDVAVVDATVTEVTVRGQAYECRCPVVVWADDPAWAGLAVGARVEASGRFAPSEDSAKAAELNADQLVLVDRGAWWWVASDHVRDAIAESVAGRPQEQAALVPALVDGDDSRLPPELTEDFRTSGLTHLTAVSGTNLTLVVGFVLAVGRLVRIHGRSQVVLAALATIGFVVLARPEPSVVRAAAMGLVAVVGLGSGGSRSGMRCLCWAVVALLLLDPWLARSAGFILSATATAGILVLGPPWRDTLARWLPTALAEAIAVPLAAQIACTPAIAAISGQVSLVAVVANVLVGPAVGPATVLGLLGGVVGLIWSPASHLVGLVSASCAGWIVLVGRHTGSLSGAALVVGSGRTTIGVLAVACLLLMVVTGQMLRRPWFAAVLVAAIGLVMWRPAAPGWPPPGWVMVACDVGQGDATVLNAGAGEAVVIDAGPDPAAVDHCLDRLDVQRVPLVLLTHGHADHVDGLPGVFRGRAVAEVDVGPNGGPPSPADTVRRTPQVGERVRVGAVGWTVLGPSTTFAAAGASDGAGGSEGSTGNDASVVVLASVRDVSILLTGDIETEAQAALLRAYPSLRADVLKVSHHGSAKQYPELFAQLDARIATISVGADNAYGHPDPSTLALLQAVGATALRTDEGGDIAIVERDGRLSAYTR